MLDKLLNLCVDVGLKLVVSAAIVVLGWIFSTRLTDWMRVSRKFSRLDRTVSNFMANACNIALKSLLLIIAVSIMGIPMASIITLLATAGAAVGLALQGGLSNIAGGILIMIFKPFKIGDFITADGESGTVSDINVFYTTLKTPDNKTVMLPNGTVSGGKVTNLSTEGLRRVDFEFTVDHGTNTDGVMALLEKVAHDTDKVVDDPKISTLIGGCTENGVTVYLRTWCKSEDYWDVYFSINKSVKEAFERYDVGFARPKLDVRLDK